MDQVGEEPESCTGRRELIDSGDLVDEMLPIFLALADPVRLGIIRILHHAGELCACDLEGPLDRSQPTISHHMKVLSDAGLIEGSRRGKWIWWKLSEERFEQASRFFMPFRQALSHQP